MTVPNCEVCATGSLHRAQLDAVCIATETHRLDSVLQQSTVPDRLIPLAVSSSLVVLDPAADFPGSCLRPWPATRNVPSDRMPRDLDCEDVSPVQIASPLGDR